MSDDTKSGYTKTGKKVMCINAGRYDLTYKKVYDVFTNQDGDEFVIDEAGDWRYDSMEFPNWCEKSDGMDDTDTIENNPTESAPIVSDGGSSSYYAQQIPKGMLERFNTTGTIEAKDVIRLFLGNDFNMGNIFKAYCRITSLRQGKGKAGIDEQYDLTKVKYFSEDELNYYLENKE